MDKLLGYRRKRRPIMARTVRPITATITVSSGTGSLDTSSDQEFLPIRDAGGMIIQVLVTGAGGAESDTFRLRITDSDGFIIFDEVSESAHLNTITRFPMRGTHTIEILEAQKDGDFELKLMHEELW